MVRKAQVEVADMGQDQQVPGPGGGDVGEAIGLWSFVFAGF